MAFEHRNYLPSMFLFCLVPIVLIPVLKTERSILLLSAVYFAFLGICTYQRNFVWQSEQALWEDVIKKSPGKTRSIYNYALMLKRQGKELEAIERLKPIAKVSKKNYSDIFYQLGYLQQKNRLLVEGQKNLEIASRLDPKNIDIKVLLQAVYFKNNEYEKALTLLNELKKIKPNDAQIEGNIGSAYFRLGRYEEAAEQYKIALKLDPDNQRIMQSILLSLINSKQLSAAKDFSENLLRQSKDNLKTLIWLGNIYRQFDLVREAEDFYNEAFKYTKDKSEVYAELLILYRKTNDSEKVISTLQKLLELKPNNANILNDLGSAYAKDFQYKKAVKYLSKALELNPELSQAKKNIDLIEQKISVN